MSRVASNEHVSRRFMGTVNELIKKQKEQRVRQLAPLAWTAPTFENSWINFGGSDAIAGYYLDGGSIVRLKGKVKSGTINTAIFTLATGYRPSEDMLFAVPSNGAFGIVKVSTDGVVNCISGNNTYVDLSGISFRV